MALTLGSLFTGYGGLEMVLFPFKRHKHYTTY